jgi:hypothetical protein
VAIQVSYDIIGIIVVRLYANRLDRSNPPKLEADLLFTAEFTDFHKGCEFAALSDKIAGLHISTISGDEGLSFFR